MPYMLTHPNFEASRCGIKVENRKRIRISIRVRVRGCGSSRVLGFLQDREVEVPATMTTRQLGKVCVRVRVQTWVKAQVCEG